MEVKKSPKANLEKDVFLSVLFGLLVALSVVFVALQWHSKRDNSLAELTKLDIADIDEALLVQDEQQPEEPEPEPEPQQTIEVQLPEEFKVVDNSAEVQKLKLTSADENKPLPPPPPPRSDEEDADQIFEIVEVNPQFTDGDLNKWLSKHIQYPEIAAENGIQGRVVVRFVVERDGSVAQVSIARGVDPALDKEAVRVVKSMPKWKPGMQQGKAVRARYTLPVLFRLQ